ncbi:MAG: transposase [bacterium]|nr:transposase [bacterium]
MSSTDFRRKTIRLPREVYRGPQAYSLTIATADRQPYFRESELVHDVRDMLHVVARRQFEIVAYCFMPDHLHLLVLAHEDGADLLAFVKSFKQRTGFMFRKHRGVVLWQKGYFDHILRRDEDLRIVARYIFENPVRAGLVSDFRVYPFSGSFTHDLNTLAA